MTWVVTNPDWAPGDPLYAHPANRDYGEGNYVRNLFDLHRDEETAELTLLHGNWQAACPYCLVGWGAVDEGPDCWMCGKPAANYAAALEHEHYRREAYLNWAYLKGGPLHGQTHAGEEASDVGRIDTIVYVKTGGYWRPGGPLHPDHVVTDTAEYRRTSIWISASSRWVFEYVEGGEGDA